MKKRLLIVGIASLLLASCGSGNTTSSSQSSSSSSSSSTSSSTSESSSSSTSSTSSSTSSSSTTEPIPDPTITGVSLNPSSKQTLYVGENINVRATVSGTGDFNKYVTWSDDNPGVVSYEEHQNNNYIVALQTGVVNLTATANGDSTKYDSIQIEVLDPFVETVSLSKTGTINIENNDTFSISATVTGKGTINKNVDWSSSPAGIISFGTGNSINVKAEAPGDVVLTATSKQDSSKKASVNVHVEPDFDLTLPMVYKKVTSMSEIVTGERYIVVSRTADKALGVEYSSKKPRALEVTRDSSDDSLINNVVGTTIRTVKLVEGHTSGSYAFLYNNEYLQSNGSNDLPKSTTLNESTSWSIQINGGDTKIESISTYDSQKVYLKHNNTLFGSYKATSVVSEVDLYKYYSGKEQIVFDDTEITMSTETEKDISVNVHGFNPTSFVWSSSDPTIVSVAGTTKNAKLTASSSVGNAVITCVASDGSISRTATLNVHTKSYSYDIDEGKYAITYGNNYIIPSTAKDGENLNVSDLTNYFDFIKAYEGDNTFYISNGTQYLKCNKPSQARISLTTDKVCWTVAPSSGQFILSTTVDSKTYYLTRINASNPWIVTDASSNKVDLKAVSTFKEMEVSGTLVKTKYNYDEPFDPTGLTIYAVYTSSLGDIKVDVTSKVIWDDMYMAYSIFGHVEVDGEERYVEVDGLTITHYSILSISLNTVGVKTDYFVGDTVDVTNLIVDAHYEDPIAEDYITINDVKGYTVSPTIIESSTTQITITYKEKTSSYAVNVTEPEFELTTYLTAGMKVTFAANNREMIYDGYQSTPYYSLPVGEIVFEVEKFDYPSWRFKVSSIKDTTHSENVGKYLAVDGSKKGSLKLVDEADDSFTVFSVTINSTTGDYFMLAGNGYYVSMNIDSNKFVAQSNAGYDIEIYRKITE
ncbi:MAG: hypothetical protein MJ221_00635 [Bacilli bacterium]|nr:hypothetical protein [Bacilli bacterium]